MHRATIPSRRRLTKPGPDIVSDGYPAFSPDGTRIAFTRTFGPGFTEITHESKGHWAMDGAWSPDGKAIVYRNWHGEDACMAIRTITLDGGATAIVYKADFGTDDLEGPTWRWAP